MEQGEMVVAEAEAVTGGLINLKVFHYRNDVHDPRIAVHDWFASLVDNRDHRHGRCTVRVVGTCVGCWRGFRSRNMLPRPPPCRAPSQFA